METNYIMTKKTFERVKFIQMLLVMALVFYLFIRFFGSYQVISGSMEPTIQIGDTVICYHTKEIDYDDIVTFAYDLDPGKTIRHGWDAWIAARSGEATIFVKRVVGLPGDRIEVREGAVWRNGARLDPDYLSVQINYDMEEVMVPENHYFLMGDNRNNSMDSHVFGPVSGDTIVGKVIYHFQFRNNS